MSIKDMLATFVANLLRKKNPDDFLAESSKSGLNKTLTGFDLIVLGISAIVGAGIFVMIGSAVVGTVEHVGAGPALIISIIIAGIICIFPAFCYAEFASMIPVSGSAYVYAYVTMGEFMAWLIGWILMLEYAIGTIAVASSWTGYFIQLLQGFPFLPECIKNPPVWLISNYTSVSNNPDIVNNNGRVVKQPDETTCVTYTITFTKGTDVQSITLASMVKGYYVGR